MQKASESVKTAVALFVKNEVYDIASWIAWHFAIGVDRLFIYDDNSTDGTYEVVERAARVFDISLIRIGDSPETNFYWRQRDAYFDACKRAAGTYDWIALLDSDEYVSLEHHQSIGDYLGQFPDANALALSWRIYGSSTRVLRTKLPVYEAYNHHSTRDLGDNTLVKSFVRPDKVLYHYISPHKFLVEDEKYVDSLGQPVKWDESCKEVEWRGACVNHYICRSMENYVERIRRRLGADLHNSTVYWDHFNRNDLHHAENPVLIQKANQNLQKVKEACVAAFIASFRREDSHFTANPVKAQIVRIRTADNATLVLNGLEGKVVQNWQGGHHPFEVKGVIYEDDEDIVYLFVEMAGSIWNVHFHIDEDSRKLWAYKFTLEDSIIPGKSCLRSPVNKKYICFAPNDNGGRVECTRDDASGWEAVTLEPIPDATFEGSTSPNRVTDMADLMTCLSSPAFRVSYNDFILMVASLSQMERIKLLRKDGGEAIGWII